MRKFFGWTYKEITLDAISGFVLLLFFYTALSKLSAYEQFKDVLSTSPLLHDYASMLAWAIPVTELVLAFLLFLPVTRLKGLYGSLGLMFVFTVYLAWMVKFASHLPCNCGGVISKLNWNQHIVFNLSVIVLIILGIVCYGTSKPTNYYSPP